MGAKMMIAGVAAAAGVGLAAWSGFSQLGPGRDARSASRAWEAEHGQGPRAEAGAEEADAEGTGPGVERRVGGPGGGFPNQPAWAEPLAEPGDGWRFDSVSNATDAAEALDMNSGILEQIVTTAEDLGALGGASKLSLIESWRLFIRPIIADDPTALATAIAALGGSLGAPDQEGTPAESGVSRRLRTMLGGASIDWRAASTRRADAANPTDVPRRPNLPENLSVGAIPMMTMVIRNEDNGVVTERRAVSIPLQPVFPRAAEAAEGGAPVVEVWVPAAVPTGTRLAPDVGVATFLVWEADARRWAPVAMRVTLETEEGRGAFDRAAPGGG